MISLQHVAIAAGLSVFYLVAYAFYNLFLSPLRKYPGPWLCKITRIPLTIQLLRGTQVHWVRQNHEKYGRIVRIAPSQLSFTDERAWGDVLGSTPAAKYGMPQDKRLNRLIGGETINPDPNKSKAEQKHTQMRRAFAPGLTKTALRQQGALIERHVNELIEEIKIRGSSGIQAVDVVDMYNFLAYNIFSDLFVGDPFNLFKDSTHVPWVHSTKGFAKATTSMAALQNYTLARYFLAFFIRRYGAKYRDAFTQPALERFDRRAADKTNTRPDLFHFATTEKKKDQQLPFEDMRNFSPFLMLAGGETTPSVLSGLTYCLTSHPDKLARLVKEIRSTFKSSDDLTMEALLRLQYLNVCIDETLRVYPPISAGVDRIVPKTGAPIAGEMIPGGTFVLVAHYSMHNHSMNFARSDEWVPERWLPEEAGPEFDVDRKNAFRPFSVGPHACFGQDLAHYVMRLVICKLLLNFDMELHSDSETWMKNQKCYFGFIRPELKVYFTPRKA